MDRFRYATAGALLGAAGGVLFLLLSIGAGRLLYESMLGFTSGDAPVFLAAVVFGGAGGFLLASRFYSEPRHHSRSRGRSRTMRRYLFPSLATGAIVGALALFWWAYTVEVHGRRCAGYTTTMSILLMKQLGMDPRASELIIGPGPVTPLTPNELGRLRHAATAHFYHCR